MYSEELGSSLLEQRQMEINIVDLEIGIIISVF